MAIHPERRAPIIGRKTAVIMESFHQCESLLLDEAHHRTANAFQIASAMIARTQRDISDARARGLLIKVEAQLRAFALLNDQLHWRRGNSPEPRLCAAAYIRAICAQLGPACLTDIGVGMSVQAAEPQLLPELWCRHLGLITTELVLNAAKHAFVGREEGEVRVALGRATPADPIRLIVADNGIGCGDLEMDPRRGLGFVQLLAEAIGAGLAGATGAFGAAFVVTLAAGDPPPKAFASS